MSFLVCMENQIFRQRLVNLNSKFFHEALIKNCNQISFNQIAHEIYYRII